MLNKYSTTCLVLASLCLLSCTPTVQIAAPEKPIEINLNVTIEQHVKLSIEKDVQKVISKNKDIF